MKAEPIVIERTYNAPVSKLWKAITDEDQMKQWYFDVSSFKPEIGFEFSFIGENEGKKFLHLCKITEVVTGKKLSYTWKYDEYPSIETVVTFELFDEGNNTTKVRLTHTGVEQLPQDKNYKKENFIAGWTQIIGTSLKEFVEKVPA